MGIIMFCENLDKAISHIKMNQICYKKTVSIKINIKYKKSKQNHLNNSNKIKRESKSNGERTLIR